MHNSNKYIFAVLTLLLMLTGNAFADHITISKAWTPETAPVAKVMAAYMDITNRDKDSSYITAISSPQFKKVEIHNMFHKNGMMIMEKQDKLVLPAGKTVSLKPGGYHVMLFNPHKWYQAGGKITLKIILDNKHSFKIEVPIIKDTGNNMGHHHH